MARVSTYLNFRNQTEEAFRFYAKVFGTELGHLSRFKDIPAGPDSPPVPPEVAELVMHADVPILGGHLLMGTDAPEAMGFKVVQGNNAYIMLEPDTREQTTALFAALSEGGMVEQPLQDTFWGAYYGSAKDKFGVQWMFNCLAKA
ncbi:MAG: VOC family protein [Fibrobacteres bacterium]|jgi:PhnB protein|nr:VOC family protein [Fibrobacterota bacterium]